MANKERIGLMIIRAWVEEGSSKPLRAHIRLTSDVSAGVEHTVALADIEGVRDAVDSWLRGIVADVTPV